MARALRSLFAAAAVVAVAGLSAEAPPRVMLTKNIKTPDPIPRAGIEAATRAMESGRLYRYNVDAAEDSELSVCEQQIADYTVRSLATRDARALSGSLLARARSLTRAPSLSLSSVARARARARGRATSTRSGSTRAARRSSSRCCARACSRATRCSRTASARRRGRS